MFSVWEMGKRIKIDSFDLIQIYPPRVERVLENGVGDIVLDDEGIELVGGDSDTSYAFMDRGLFAVPDAKAVAQKIEAARLDRRQTAEREIIAEMQEDYQVYLRKTGGL